MKFWKKILPALLAVLLSVPQEWVFAEDLTGLTIEDPGVRYEMEEQFYQMTPETNSLENWPQGPMVNAASAIVMDMQSGAILYGKRINDRHYPASITKILTALVALENSYPEDKVTFSQASVDILSDGDAHIGMTPGEELKMEDALYAVLLASANEVSYAVAESIGTREGGGYDTFIRMMNERSEELGCTGSHWENPHGLHSAEHYTTAHDMALIASEVYEYERFRTITGTLEYRIGPTNLVNEQRVFQQNHKMLWQGNQYYYEYCTGGKTGYTDQSGTTLVTMADNGTMQLAAVVLQDYGGVSYDDTRQMLDYVFQNFTKVPVASQTYPQEIESFQDPDAYVVLPQGVSFSQLEAEITEEDRSSRMAKVTWRYQGQEVGSTQVKLFSSYFGKAEDDDLIWEPGTAASGTHTAGETGQDKGREEGSRGGVVRIIVIAVACIGALLLFMTYINYKRRLLRRKRNAYRRMIKKRIEEGQKGQSSQGNPQRSRGPQRRPDKRGTES